MKEHAHVTVLISGRGSNLKSLITGATSYRVHEIVTDNPDAAGLNFGAEFGIKTSVIPRAQYSKISEFKSAIFETVKASSPQIVCLAGYMQIVQAEFVNYFSGRLVNIHPSLLPALPGLDTHRRALSSGLKQHGCSVHFVDSGVDTGAVIAQSKVMIGPQDTEERLSARVLEKEHFLYPWVVNNLALKKIALRDNKVWYAPELYNIAKEWDISLAF